VLPASTSVRSLASFYGFTCPVTELDLSIGDYVARTCDGHPRIGSGTAWERAELVVSEIDGCAIRKVRLRILPLRDRRGPRSVVHERNPKRRSQDRDTASPASRP